MINRRYERVTFNTECVLHLTDHRQMECRTLDVSMGGLKVTNTAPQVLYPYIGTDCMIEFPVVLQEVEDAPLTVLKVQARIVNGDALGIGLAFQGVDRATQGLLQKLVSCTLQAGDLLELQGKEGVTIQGPHVKLLKIELQDHLAEAVREIFIAFLGMSVTLGPYVERPDFSEYQPPETDVTGVVLFNGSLEGGVHLAAPLHFAINAAGALLGEAGLDYRQEQEAMVWDAFGEITNQVAGSLQTRISSEFPDIRMTAPIVIQESNERIRYKRSLNSVRHFFGSAFGPFYVECFFV
ncbi:chemotaxis protein CheX [Candidatus Magnetaquicoccus inordinatus]|uniref:chemotaxis protein CheX n=1 Tax=Candidatus Magnetaquicoccus inordinatus TaxID=2496818 RepID=UPI00102BBB24|nr:chemotaxis protein CheX [Candidatus Magnetaquicoccus inordinatus]